MAAYIESEIGCDIKYCQSHDKATLVINGLGYDITNCDIKVFTLPDGWALRRLSWWSGMKILCPIHNK